MSTLYFLECLSKCRHCRPSAGPDVCQGHGNPIPHRVVSVGEHIRQQLDICITDGQLIPADLIRQLPCVLGFWHLPMAYDANFGAGTHATTVVPLPGVLWMSNFPPNDRILSRILAWPMLGR
jgi:hypothetical protein